MSLALALEVMTTHTDKTNNSNEITKAMDEVKFKKVSVTVDPSAKITEDVETRVKGLFSTESQAFITRILVGYQGKKVDSGKTYADLSISSGKMLKVVVEIA